MEKDKEMDAVRGGCAVQLGWNWETQESLERLPPQLCLHGCLFTFAVFRAVTAISEIRYLLEVVQKGI